jgi:hypothetical protein
MGRKILFALFIYWRQTFNDEVGQIIAAVRYAKLSGTQLAQKATLKARKLEARFDTSQLTANDETSLLRNNFVHIGLLKLEGY